MKRRAPLISEIQQAVAKRYCVPVSIMTQPDGIGARLKEFVQPRQVAMILAVDITRHGPTRVGQLFGGRDHSTVFHARRVVYANAELRLALIRLKLELSTTSFQRSENYGLVPSSNLAP